MPHLPVADHCNNAEDVREQCRHVIALRRLMPKAPVEPRRRPRRRDDEEEAA